MATFDEITTGVMSGTPPVSPGVTSTPNTSNSFESITSKVMSSSSSYKPIVLSTEPVDTRTTLKKVSDGAGDISELFVTGMGSTTGRILNQVFRLGTEYLKVKDKLKDVKRGVEQKLLKKVGINLKDRKGDSEYIAKLDDLRTRFAKNVQGGADIINEENPLADTFGGQTAQILGGVVPQVALAFAKAPQIALALSESVMNAEDAYTENINSGMDSREAMKRALPQLGADLAGTYITNKLGAFGKFSGAGTKIFKSRIIEGLKDSTLEVAQELWQTGLQNLATDKPFTEGMGETAKLTIIPALLFGTAGNIGSVKTKEELKTKVSQAVSVMNDKIANGEKLTPVEEGLQAIVGDTDPFMVESVSAIPPTPTMEEAMAQQVAATPSQEPVEVAAETKQEVPATPVEEASTPKSDTTFTSRVFERIKEERPDLLQGELLIEKTNLQADLDRAADLIKKDLQKAYDIAMGKEQASDVLSTSVSIALSEKALQEGNYAMYAKLVKNRSLEQTRRGKEIAAEKGSVTDNSTARYVKDLLSIKLEALGDKYLSTIKDVEGSKVKRSRKQKAVDIIDEEVNKLDKKIKAKKLDVKTALSLLDKLKCV